MHAIHNLGRMNFVESIFQFVIISFQSLEKIKQQMNKSSQRTFALTSSQHHPFSAASDFTLVTSTSLDKLDENDRVPDMMHRNVLYQRSNTNGLCSLRCACAPLTL